MFPAIIVLPVMVEKLSESVWSDPVLASNTVMVQPAAVEKYKLFTVNSVAITLSLLIWIVDASIVKVPVGSNAVPKDLIVEICNVYVFKSMTEVRFAIIDDTMVETFVTADVLA